LAIIGKANLREALEERLEKENLRYFGCEEELMYTFRESQLIRHFYESMADCPKAWGRWTIFLNDFYTVME